MRKKNMDPGEYVPMLQSDRNKCVLIADFIMVQCIVIIAVSCSIEFCFWTPDDAFLDFDKLARIMYLFDSHVCGYKLEHSNTLYNLHLSNDTKGSKTILPIKWMASVNLVSTRLSFHTRKYIKLSISFHSIWALIALVTRVFAKRCVDLHPLKTVLVVFFYSCITIIAFDISMALVYISHIKQSLTQGMILRYSGWSSTLKLDNYESFGGWLPIVASCCWLRGIFIFVMNIYCTRRIKIIRKKIRRREIKKKYENERYLVIPDPKPTYFNKEVIVYHNQSTTFY